MNRHLYLCSSVRHIYLAMGLALTKPEDSHRLLLVNQAAGKSHLMLSALLKSPYPFDKIDVCVTQRGGLKKFLSRRRALWFIADCVAGWQPTHVYAGNDRLVEFQFAMRGARQLPQKALGCFLDDGTSSYINVRYIKAWRAFSDLTFDRMMKRIFYGGWYEKVKILGGTKWVDECYLTFPQLAPTALTEAKKIIGLNPADYKSKAFLTLIEQFIPQDTGGIKSALPRSAFYEHYDAFLVLPSYKFIVSSFTGVAEYNAKINSYLRRFNKIAVKYHPRETQFYFKSDVAVTTFPANIPAEILFSFVHADCVVGDLSTALMSAIWLLPNSRVVCVCPPSLSTNPLVALMQRAGIEIDYGAE